MNQLTRLKEADFNIFINNLNSSNATNNISAKYAYAARYFVRSLDWLPDFKEFLLFGSFIALIFVIMEVIHSMYINTTVQSKSRCVNNDSKDKNKLYAADQNNRMYTVSYNNNKKTADIQCEGSGGGTTTNTYNIRVYDYNSKAMMTQQKTCERQGFTAAAGTSQTADKIVYYSGDPMLVDYMMTGNTVYFNP
jgi:hypothetical protein